MGQAADHSIDDYACAGLVKPDRTGQAGAAFTACKICRRLRPPAQDGKKMCWRKTAEQLLTHMKYSSYNKSIG